MKPADGIPLSLHGNGDSPSSSLLSTDRLEDPALTNGPRVLRDAYVEWDDPDTIAAIESELSSFGEVVRLEANEDFPAALANARPDVVFNVAEGIGGACRESFVPTFCEFWNIPYTGSDPLALATCLDKARTKEVLSHHGIPTPEFVVAADVEDLDRIPDLPCVVKPLHEGSSKGITRNSLCTTEAEVGAEVRRITSDYGEPAIVERYLDGREFTVAMLGAGSDVRTLPIVELDFKTLPPGAPAIYGYEAKWIWDRPEQPLDIFQCPADCDPELQRRIDELCLAAFRALKCRDWGRIDVRCDQEGTPHILEVNPLPGIIPDPDANSCYPKAARAAGLTYGDVIQVVLRAGVERHGLVLAG